MQTWFLAMGVACGLLFLALHVGRAVVAWRHAGARDERLEAVGAAVPGLAGLLLAAAIVAPPGFLTLALAVLMVLVLVLGRAAYEWVVFRGRR